MDKLLKYLMLLLVTTLSLTFTACGGDDNDEPEKPNIPGTENTDNSEYDGYVASKSSISFYPIRNGNQYYAEIRPSVDSFTYSGHDFRLYSKIAFIGNYKRIKDIDGLNSISEWKAVSGNNSYRVTYNNVKESDCFLIEITDSGSSDYLIYQFGPSKKNLSGDVIGYYYNLQSYNAN